MSRNTLRPRSAATPAAAPSHAEPDALESFLAELQQLRERAAGLALAVSRETAGDSRPARRALAQEIQAAHRRVEALLAEASAQDGVRLPPVSPRSAPPSERKMISQCRRVARELEEQCASASSHARSLGLGEIAAALQRWRCEMIGLERPLIAAHAEAEHPA